MTYEALLISSFAVYRKVRTFDGQGGWEESWSEVGTVQGRLRPTGGSEAETARQEQRVMAHVLYTLANVDVQRGDMVVGEGQVLDVLGIREPSHAGHHLEIDCQEHEKEPGEVSS